MLTQTEPLENLQVVIFLFKTILLLFRNTEEALYYSPSVTTWLGRPVDRSVKNNVSSFYMVKPMIARELFDHPWSEWKSGVRRLSGHKPA